jgi:hypothetical protein
MNAIRLALLLPFAITACDDPGEGPKAARGYARAAPVINALETFRRLLRRYPDSLTDLVPVFLPATALAVPTGPQEHYPLQYRTDSGEFTLTFRYVGPGMNECSFSTPARKWNCSGYY